VTKVLHPQVSTNNIKGQTLNLQVIQIHMAMQEAEHGDENFQSLLQLCIASMLLLIS